MCVQVCGEEEEDGCCCRLVKGENATTIVQSNTGLRACARGGYTHVYICMYRDVIERCGGM